MMLPTILSAAATDVLAERERQKADEGWTTGHDDLHGSGELAGAAACYAMLDLLPGLYDSLGLQVKITIRDLWPWDKDWWKPKDRRRNLVRAAALLIAEIERIDRMTEAPK